MEPGSFTKSETREGRWTPGPQGTHCHGEPSAFCLWSWVSSQSPSSCPGKVTGVGIRVGPLEACPPPAPAPSWGGGHKNQAEEDGGKSSLFLAWPLEKGDPGAAKRSCSYSQTWGQSCLARFIMQWGRGPGAAPSAGCPFCQGVQRHPCPLPSLLLG